MMRLEVGRYWGSIQIGFENWLGNDCTHRFVSKDDADLADRDTLYDR
jgi:hypothetical protein